MSRTSFAPTPVAFAVAAFFCVTAAPAMAASVTITNSGCQSFTAIPDGNGNLTVTCDSGTPPSPPPPGAPSCTSLTATPASLPTGGGMVALTAEGCPAGAILEWSASTSVVGLSATTTTNKQSVQSVAATTTFGVAPVVNGLKGNAVNRVVTVAPSTVEPPGAVGSCSGFSATRTITASVPPSGGNNAIYTTLKAGGFGANDAVVVAFQAPAADGGFGISAVTLSGSASSFHSFVLASRPCIFDKADPSALGGNTQTKPEFTVNMQSTASAVFGKYKLDPGVTYYLNLSHKSYCGSSCDLQLTFTNSN
jgi:hypothetical protein